MADAGQTADFGGRLVVDAGGSWVGLGVERLALEAGAFVSIEPDPQISVTFQSPLRFVGLEVRLDGAYAGDRFCLYYSAGDGKPFDETTSVTFDLAEGSVATLLAFDTPVERVRIDPVERVGETRIASIAVVAAKEKDRARELLAAHDAELEPSSIPTLPVTVDPDKRDAFAAFTSSAVKAEIRARKRLARPAVDASAPEGLAVVIDPQPNLIDPDAMLLEAPLERLSEELFGARVPVPAEPIGSASASLVICVAATAFGPSFGKNPWKLPESIEALRSLCFASAGSAVLGLPGEHGFTPPRRQAQLLRLFFGGPWLHGVRDAFTAELLEKAGVSNFVVTGTPSLWDVSPELGREIPEAKGERALFAADENYRDPKNDLVTLRRLGEAYGEVALWPRDASVPVDYAKRLIAAAKLEGTARVLEPGPASLDAYLAREGVDYVGPNLEAGIRALKAKRRTLILTADDRSIGVAALCSLPSMHRYEVADVLRAWIRGTHATQLSLPTGAVERWKAQFTR